MIRVAKSELAGLQAVRGLRLLSALGLPL